MADTAQYLKADFNQLGYDISSGDTLWVYDGANTNAPLLGVYVDGSQIETRTSSGKALTFRFKSDNTDESTGWQAELTGTNTPGTPPYYDMSSGERYVCSGIFRDDGGNSDYGIGKDLVQTFSSYDGNRMKFNFNMFDLDTYDYLEIYDGPSTAYPKIGHHEYGDNPGVVESSGRSLTFKFYSNNSSYNIGPGWEAQISCADTVLPVINMDDQTDTVNHCMFYDHEGAQNDYSSYSDYTHTLIADTAAYLSFEFNDLHTEFSSGDTLWIYDGPSTNSQLLGVFVEGSNIEDFTSSSDAVTLRFKSDHANTSQGWQAEIQQTDQSPAAPIQYSMSSGIRYTCDGIFYDHKGDKDYYNDKDQTQTFIAKGGQRLKVQFNNFETYSSSDYLKIYDGMNTSANLLGTYDGTTNPGTLKASDSALTFSFHSDNSYTAPGWKAKFSCININPPTITQQPSNQQVCKNDSVIFNIKATGADTIQYQWKKDGNALTGEDDSILVIAGVTAADAGDYYCVVNNPYGSDSSQIADLQVFSLPQINLGNDTTISTSQEIVLDAGSGFKTYKWYNAAGSSTVSFDADSAGTGYHDAWVLVTDTNMCTNSDTVTIEVFDDTGIDKTVKNLKVYPNPARHKLNLDFKKEMNAEVSLLNMQGKLLLTRQIENRKNVRLDISGFSAGIYNLIIYNLNGNLFSLKIEKK